MSELNITGLPPLIDELESGKLYCINMKSSLWFDMLISHISGDNNALLTFRNIDNDYPSIFDRVQSEQLKVFQLAQNKLNKLFKKVDRLFNELRHLKVSSGALYLDLSDLCLGSKHHNELLISQLKRFADLQQLTIVLLFSEASKGSAIDQFLFQNRNAFHGVMKFNGETEPTQLNIDIWYTESGCVVNQQYHIQNLNGHLALTSSDNTDIAISQFEQSNVVVDQHYKELGPKLNKGWTLAQNEDDLIRLVKENPSTTVLLHALNSTSLKSLAQVIYKLRQMAGQDLKVIVLEVNIKLRLTEQSILRCLGANIMLPSSIHINTLINIISATANLVYVGDLTADFQDVFDEGSLPSSLGYLSPMLFSLEVDFLMDSSKKYGISSALVVLEIPSGIAAMDTIKYAQFNRHGDIFTIVDTSIYIYLYGCRDEDIMTTLTYILGAEPLLLFRSEKNYVKSDAIELQNMHLLNYIEKNPTVDYHERIAEFSEHKASMEKMHPSKVEEFEINIAVPVKLKLK